MDTEHFFFDTKASGIFSTMKVSSFENGVTPPKFNIAPEKWWLEDEFPFGIAYF